MGGEAGIRRSSVWSPLLIRSYGGSEARARGDDRRHAPIACRCCAESHQEKTLFPAHPLRPPNWTKGNRCLRRNKNVITSRRGGGTTRWFLFLWKFFWKKKERGQRLQRTLRSRKWSSRNATSKDTKCRNSFSVSFFETKKYFSAREKSKRTRGLISFFRLKISFFELKISLFRRKWNEIVFDLFILQTWSC